MFYNITVSAHAAYLNAKPKRSTGVYFYIENNYFFLNSLRRVCNSFIRKTVIENQNEIVKLIKIHVRKVIHISNLRYCITGIIHILSDKKTITLAVNNKAFFIFKEVNRCIQCSNVVANWSEKFGNLVIGGY